MIGFLKGVLATKQAPTLCIDVQGVGYELETPMSTFYELPDVGEDLRLLTHLVVREDAHVLYGFATDDERSLFRSLLKISGVGAKMALAILSGISVEGFVRCVQEEDATSLVRVPGIGKKTAERLIMEMKHRIGDTVVEFKPGAGLAIGKPQSPVAEATSALVSLGYKPVEVARMMTTLETDGQTTEQIIRQVLKHAAS